MRTCCAASSTVSLKPPSTVVKQCAANSKGTANTKKDTQRWDGKKAKIRLKHKTCAKEKCCKSAEIEKSKVQRKCTFTFFVSIVLWSDIWFIFLRQISSIDINSQQRLWLVPQLFADCWALICWTIYVMQNKFGAFLNLQLFFAWYSSFSFACVLCVRIFYVLAACVYAMFPLWQSPFSLIAVFSLCICYVC